jgi:hypothetical protein
MLLIAIVALSVQLYAQNCSFSSGEVTITSVEAISCSTLTISKDATVTINGDVTLANQTWNVEQGAIVTINGSLTMIGSSTITNNGTFDVAGTTGSNFTMNAGTFNNYGRFDVTNADFIMYNGAKFINQAYSVVVIHNAIEDNKEDNKKVVLGSTGNGNQVPFSSAGLDIQKESIFTVSNTDMNCFIEGTGNTIAGELHVIDGNLTIGDVKNSGSAGITIPADGGLFVVDTDLNTEPSKGMIIIPNGAKETFTVEGDLFATGLDDGNNNNNNNNNTITGSNGQVFIGNSSSSDSFKYNNFSGTEKSCSATSVDFAECYENFLTLGRSRSIRRSFLPIDLSAFSVQAIDKGALVSWTTQSEANNDFFTVLRSHDGYIFEEIAQLSGANTSSAATDYNFTDTQPYNGVSYYRLKQTDYDGKYSYSSVVPFLFNAQAPAFEIVTRTQNGISTLDLHFFGTENINYIALYTLQGILLYSQSVPAGIDNLTITLPLSTGVYVVTHAYNASKQSIKITIQ